MTRLPALAILALLPTLGCFSSSDTGGAAKESAEESPKKKGRTYANPETKLTAEERGDILALCTAVAGCDRAACSRSEESRAYKAVEVQSEWGKLMQKHLTAEGRAKAGKRLARLLVTEDMKWASTDCRAVVKKYSHTYQ